MAIYHCYINISQKNINLIRIDCFNEINFNLKWESLLKKYFLMN